MKYTKNPKVWLEYLCWNIQWWMHKHRPPRWPMFVQKWAYKRYGERRFHTTWSNIRGWQRYQKSFVLTDDKKPLPWWLGTSCEGPLQRPWGRIASVFGKCTGGRSHRCEFTDKEWGALYGHNRGAFMNEYFDEFLENISV